MSWDTCLTEKVAYYAACTAAAGAAAAVTAELLSGVAAGLTVPTAMAGIAALVGVIAAGMSLHNCLIQAGKHEDAESLKREMDQLQHEVDQLKQHVPA
jgi:hypothetical protein